MVKFALSLAPFLGPVAADYVIYHGKTAYEYGDHGAIDIDTDATAPVGLSVADCEARCDGDAQCDCVAFRPSDGKCWKRAQCVPEKFGTDSLYDTYVRTAAPGPTPGPSPGPSPGPAGSLCGGAAVVDPSSDWVWSYDAVPSPSCSSPAVENVAQMCAGDPTSVVIRGNGQPQCLSAQMLDCKFSMFDIDQLDFDTNMVGCKGTWAAPLWMTPNYWAGGGDSGEIDMLENCPTDQVWSNFAGGGQQVAWSFADTDSFSGHTTMWKQADDDGVMSIHVKTCKANEVVGGSCSEVGDVAYLRDVYGKNGCSNGADCIYTLVSDIWNGVAGDAGFQGCAGGQPHYSSGCSVSVSNIRFKASAGAFTGHCAKLNADSATLV